VRAVAQAAFSALYGGINVDPSPTPIICSWGSPLGMTTSPKPSQQGVHMADDGKEALSRAADAALDAFVADGCPVDVNEYLDDRKVTHPRVTYQRATRENEAPREDFVPCDPPLVPTSKWVPDREGGHMFWYCALPK
jgi:hypothetical protein